MTLQIFCVTPTILARAGSGGKKVQTEPHSTFVFNEKDFTASTQMSHHEEVLGKMTPRIRPNIPLHMVLDTSSHGCICESGLGERLSVFTPKSFRVSHFSRSQDYPPAILIPGHLSAWLCTRYAILQHPWGRGIRFLSHR